jgi:hypothetical protein
MPEIRRHGSNYVTDRHILKWAAIPNGGHA